MRASTGTGTDTAPARMSATFGSAHPHHAYVLRQSERHSADQRNLLEEKLGSDLTAVEREIEQLQPTRPATDKQQPKRTPLPTNLPRCVILHEP